MKSLEIYDPPMCCSTGVCSTEVDPVLVQFASDTAWLGQQGIRVRRFNLAQQPAAFAINPAVSAELRSGGNACLPLLLLDGIVVSKAEYPSRLRLVELLGLDSVDEEGETR